MRIEKLYLSEIISQWIESCVVIESTDFLSYIPQTLGFPEATPEFIIILNGHLNVSYGTKSYNINNSCLFTFIDKPILITPSSNIHVIKITFRSFGVFPLVKLSGTASKELISSPIILAHDLFGDEIRVLEEKLFDCNSNIELQNNLNHFLISKLSRKVSNQIDSSILNLDLQNIYSVNELCKAIHVTPRTLQRWFALNMDLSPKFYLKLLRLKSLIKDLSATNKADYLNLAIKHGFYDQNHMIKEIKFFTDQTPKELSFNQYLPIQLDLIS